MSQTFAQNAPPCTDHFSDVCGEPYIEQIFADSDQDQSVNGENVTLTPDNLSLKERAINLAQQGFPDKAVRLMERKLDIDDAQTIDAALSLHAELKHLQYDDIAKDFGQHLQDIGLTLEEPKPEAPKPPKPTLDEPTPHLG